MKKILFILGALLLTSCYSTRFVDSWKNKEITSFKPEKLLVIGMTNNLTARKIFEEDMKNSLTQRGINTIESATILDESFTDSQKNEAEIDKLKEQLLEEGFDAVAITAVVGEDDRRRHAGGHYTFGYDWYRFGRYYYRFQNVYYAPEYYEDYQVYHIETSIYNIKDAGDKELVWVGTFDIVDPHSLTSTVKDYVQRIVLQLERDGVIIKVE